MDAASIAAALGGKRAGAQFMARCPAHDDRTPSLSLRDGDDGRLLVHCFTSCAPLDVLAALRRLGHLDDAPVERPAQRPTSATPAPTGLRWSPRADGVWRPLDPFEPTRVPFFGLRGCADARGVDIRFAPAMEHWPTKTTWPAIVSRVTDFLTGEPLTLHFTYLGNHNTTKAPVDPARLFLPGHVTKGGVVRLTDDADVVDHLGVAEGVETALAVTAALGAGRDFLPVWSTLTAGTMRDLPVLPAVKRLTIYADADPSGTGQRAAHTLADRWHAAGREVFIATPPAPPGGTADWNAP